MARTVAIRIQNFGDLIRKNYFYIDKTHFIKEWWENGDSVTLIARPRRFGKTLNMSMLEQFFSVSYADGEGKNLRDYYKSIRQIFFFEGQRSLDGQGQEIF